VRTNLWNDKERTIGALIIEWKAKRRIQGGEQKEWLPTDGVLTRMDRMNVDHEGLKGCRMKIGW